MKKLLAPISLMVLMLFVVFAVPLVVSGSMTLSLQAEQHWETYGVGGTCIPGQHNAYIADVDGDGTPEILTGGHTYEALSNGSHTTIMGSLKIWSWDGQHLILECSEKWPGSVSVVYAADVDGDGKTEILTVGTAVNQTGITTALKLWNWNGQTLTVRGNYSAVTANSLAWQMWMGMVNRKSSRLENLTIAPRNLAFGNGMELSLR
jgi:hypothetical protein